MTHSTEHQDQQSGESVEERRRRRAREAQARFRARQRGEYVPFLIRTGRPRPTEDGPTKVCRDCGKDQPREEFYSVKVRGKPDRLHSYCKPCCTKRQVAWHYQNREAEVKRLKDRYWADPEASRAKSRQYRSENRDRLREHDSQRWRRTGWASKLRQYGLNADQYDQLASSQDGVCAICRRPNDNGHHLVVDHDHKSGQIRGLLCHKCNVGIGLLRDSAVVVRAACAYLEDPPAARVVGGEGWAQPSSTSQVQSLPP